MVKQGRKRMAIVVELMRTILSMLCLGWILFAAIEAGAATCVPESEPHGAQAADDITRPQWGCGDVTTYAPTLDQKGPLLEVERLHLPSMPAARNKIRGCLPGAEVSRNGTGERAPAVIKDHAIQDEPMGLTTFRLMRGQALAYHFDGRICKTNGCICRAYAFCFVTPDANNDPACWSHPPGISFSALNPLAGVTKRTSGLWNRA